MTISIFDDVPNQWWSPLPGKISEEMDRAARRALDATGDPQGVHGHAEGLPCSRGLCYVLKVGGRSDGGS